MSCRCNASAALSFILVITLLPTTLRATRSCPTCAADHQVTTAEFADYFCADCMQLVSSSVTPASAFEAPPRVDHWDVANLTPTTPLMGVSQPWKRTWTLGNIFTGECQQHVEQIGEARLDPFFYDPFWKFTGDLYEDTLHFYSPQILAGLGVSLGTAAILANTDADENFREWYFDNVRDNSPDTHWAKILGEAYLVPPLIAITWALTEYREANPATRGGELNDMLRQWSAQSTRAFLTAALPVYSLQWITGASRPGEDPTKGSHWKFLDDNNGVSGHTAVGAIPFLVAAKMTDEPILKWGFYFGSTLAGYSRVYDDAHYLSQVLLGYAIAYLAVESTAMTNESNTGYRVVPLTIGGAYGFGVERRY